MVQQLLNHTGSRDGNDSQTHTEVGHGNSETENDETLLLMVVDIKAGKGTPETKPGKKSDAKCGLGTLEALRSSKIYEVIDQMHMHSHAHNAAPSQRDTEPIMLTSSANESGAWLHQSLMAKAR